jgi:hypothetical protein
MRSDMRLVFGKAQLHIQPALWLDPRRGEQGDQAAAVLRALWYAHPCITAITIGHDWPAITVDLALPADGHVDLAMLQRQLAQRAQAALTG